MPVYEYQCLQCAKKVSLLLRIGEDDSGEKCPSCGATGLRKLVSRVQRYRTESQRLDHAADQLETHGEPESPTEIRRMVREVGKALDDDFSDEMEEIFEEDQSDEA